MDVDYQEAVSIVELPITSPIHKPCPSMAGLVNYDPKKTDRARSLIPELREKLGIQKHVTSKRISKPLNYICTERGCIEPWGAVSNAMQGQSNEQT